MSNKPFIVSPANHDRHVGNISVHIGVISVIGVILLFLINSFEGKHQFHSKFAEGYLSIVKYRSVLIEEIKDNILTELTYMGSCG